MRGEIRIDPFITHRMGLEDVNRAFDLMHQGKGIRTVLTMNNAPSSAPKA
jgi:S-(hydroxymethyl)glutathione dehydrogenase/alcohol dehydrogenase